MGRLLAVIACATLLYSAEVLAEGRTPYAPVIKAAMLKPRIERDGEQYVRFLMKSNSDDIAIGSVVITIERDGKVLKTIKPTLRDLPDDASPDEYPWEILLPVGKEYLHETEMVHNQEPGALSLQIAYTIKGKGTSVTGVE